MITGSKILFRDSKGGLFERQVDAHLISEESDTLIIRSANESIKQLEDMQMKSGREIPMSEFAKILIWEKQELQTRWEEEMERGKRKGYKYSDRTWCGVPYNEFSIPRLGLY